jgi:hypothetical protein
MIGPGLAKQISMILNIFEHVNLANPVHFLITLPCQTHLTKFQFFPPTSKQNPDIGFSPNIEAAS